MHLAVFVGPVDATSTSVVCDAKLLGQGFEDVAVEHGHLVQKKDSHPKQSHDFLVPLREVKFRFVVGSQVEEAMES